MGTYYVVFALREWDNALKATDGLPVTPRDLGGQVGFLPVYGTREDSRTRSIRITKYAK